MDFHWSTIGHDAAKLYLEKLMSHPDLPAHAFLFVGQEHIGKTTFVREFAAKLMCQDESVRPCGHCVHCQHLAKGQHPDVFRIQRHEDRSLIAVEDVRDVLEQLSESSFFKHRKICLIEEAHELSVGASNALLKTLEEPTRDTVFLFVSPSEESLLPTIRSRCLTVRLYPTPRSAVYDALISRSVAQADARELARFTSGRLGLAWKFAEHPELWAQEKELVSEDIRTLFGQGFQKHRWYEDTETIPYQSFIGFAHDALLASLGLTGNIESSFYDFSIFNTAKQSDAFTLLKTCVDAVKLRAQNVNAKLVLDLIHASARNVV